MIELVMVLYSQRLVIHPYWLLKFVMREQSGKRFRVVDALEIKCLKTQALVQS